MLDLRAARNPTVLRHRQLTTVLSTCTAYGVGNQVERHVGGLLTTAWGRLAQLTPP